eukprot:COSAG02_NODE_1220_length_13807_cov_6.303254_6_plen_353_part_00
MAPTITSQSHAAPRLWQVQGHLRPSAASGRANRPTATSSSIVSRRFATSTTTKDSTNNDEMYGRVDNSTGSDQFGRIALPEYALPSTVTDQHRAVYIDRGWVCIEDVLSSSQLERICGAFEKQLQIEGRNAGSELGQTLPDPSNPGVRRLCNMMSKHDEFLALATHEVAVGFARLTIGENAKWQAMNGHDPLPGHPEARQPIHADRMFFSGCAGYMNCIWTLDDFTVERGATRLVSCSHRRQWPTDLPDPLLSVEGEEQVECRAGSLIVTHGDCWHAGCANMATAKPASTRRAIHLGFACEDTRPQYNIASSFEPRGGERSVSPTMDPTVKAKIAGLVPRSDWDWLRKPATS